jgi:23S rRNA (uridine2552-2'-O)-methyltransferase
MEKGMLVKSRVGQVKGEKLSSSTWLQRKAGDRYTRMAHEEGLVARSAYKLRQILYENRDIRGSVIVDLGAAPGGWTTVAQKMFPRSRIIAVDIRTMNYIPNTTQLVMDITSDDAPKVLAHALAGKKVDVLLSDMAPSFSGQRSIDHLRLMGLAQTALDFGVQSLRPGAALIFKLNRGGQEADFKKQLEFYFDKVTFAKPDASYKDSSEIYIIAKGFFGKGGRDNPTRIERRIITYDTTAPFGDMAENPNRPPQELTDQEDVEQSIPELADPSLLKPKEVHGNKDGEENL